MKTLNASMKPSLLLRHLLTNHPEKKDRILIILLVSHLEKVRNNNDLATPGSNINNLLGW